MGVANLKSTFITNRDATPKVFSDASLQNGHMCEAIGSVLTGASDSALSTYRLISIPSNARLSQLYWQSGALSNSAAMNVAAWFPSSVQVGGGAFLASGSAAALISSSVFAVGLLGGTATALTEITNSTGNYLIPLQETPLWNVLGLAVDPECNIDMGMMLSVGTGAAGYVGLKARYQI